MFSGPLTIAQNEEQKAADRRGAQHRLLAQMAHPACRTPTGLRVPGMGMGRAIPAGPGGMGGGVQADFDSLIDLITTTIAPESWVDVGGPGSIQEFATNLSLVVSQTQDVHEQIADLLEQLRRLQDLQVTIEVRFITLSDRFFERIGVDFDFRIDDNTHLTNQIDQLPVNAATGIVPAAAATRSSTTTTTASASAGRPAGPTADLDLAFDQDSFASTTPQFGNFDPNSGGARSALPS